MNVVFFGNKKFKENLDNYWDDKDYIYYQIENYKTSKEASYIQGEIKDEKKSLIFVPYFLFSSIEVEGPDELNSYIANIINSLPGKHIICMFTDLRSVDLSSISLAYEGITELLDKLGDDYTYLSENNYISLSQTIKSWEDILNNEISIASDPQLNEINSLEENDKKNFPTTESWTYHNGELVSHTSKSIFSEWKKEEDAKKASNVGIILFNSFYLETTETQDKEFEYQKIQEFLNKYLEEYSIINNVPIEDLSLEFMNYGKTELVYLLSEKSGKRVTLLVKQPVVELGKVYQEAQNLKELKKKDENVVAPIDYYQFGDQELYVTPYINQARCVASYDTWGMYIPEPYYRFESFTNEQERIVNTCMIAKLVSLYDFEKKQGICSCKLGGGDFMLPKGWEKQTPTIENTINNLYLIAAREKVNCSFEDYLDIIKAEFSRSTIADNQDDVIVNLRGRVSMKISDIELGIQLGKSIINSQGPTNEENNYVKKLIKEENKNEN